ncbi:MAG: hypothetical protein M1375_03125 [Candidatus Thermoplasmatota archaeon]|jgi:site-specific DNA-adenine methylase|nr:hypothetical protein [Candidatus Thermoplasmatota archaeon]
MESNSSSEGAREMYSAFKIIEVDSRRNINSVGWKRNAVKKLVICSFQDFTGLMNYRSGGRIPCLQESN